MNRSVVARLGAGLLGASLLAAACGSDDGGEGTAATIDAGVKEALGGGTTIPGQTTTTIETPTSMEDWEALWAEQRTAIVKRITDEGWGKSADVKTVTGPEGFTIDLAKCPAGWSDTEGLTDTSIKVGLAVAQSGSFASYNNYTKGQLAVYDYYNNSGAFKDINGKTRKVDLLARDDGYDPARTIPLVTEFLDSEKVFAVWTLGSPNTLKTYDNINARCVPHPQAITAHAAWGDPVNHPWTTGPAALSYSSEAIFWGSFIEQHIDEFTDDQIRVAALVMNNDFGKLYDSSFRAYVAQSDVLRDRIDYSTEQIEAASPQITDPMTTLAAEDPHVFILMAAATPCTQAVAEAAQNGMKESTEYLFQPLTCAGTQFVKKEAVGGDGSTADGWWIVTYGAKDLTDPAFQDDAFVQWAREQLQKAGTPAETSSLLGGGVVQGWIFSQTVMIAGQLPGGLTRSNFTLAERSMDMTNPMFVSGVRFHMNGNVDPYYIEAGQYNKWDAAKQSWLPQGDVTDLDGKSRPCPWDAAASVCR